MLLCSTHPHSTYVQILAEIGVIGFMIVLFTFLKSLKTNLIFILKKKKNKFGKIILFY